MHIIHLIWIIPLSSSFGLLIAFLFLSNKKENSFTSPESYGSEGERTSDWIVLQDAPLLKYKTVQTGHNKNQGYILFDRAMTEKEVMSGYKTWLELERGSL